MTMPSSKRKRPSQPSPKAGSHPHGNAAPFNPAPVTQDKGAEKDYHSEGVGGSRCVAAETGTGRKS